MDYLVAWIVGLIVFFGVVFALFLPEYVPGNIFRHDDRGAAAEEREGVDVAGNPVGQRLGGEGLGIGVARRPQHGHEQLGRPDLAGGHVGDRQGHAREVHEELLAGPVLLAHDQVEPTRPAPIGLTEPGVAEAVGVALPVLEPQELQGDALAAQLAVDRRPVGGRSQRCWQRR